MLLMYEKGNLIRKICEPRERDLLLFEEFWGEVKQERTRSAVAACSLRCDDSLVRAREYDFYGVWQGFYELYCISCTLLKSLYI